MASVSNVPLKDFLQFLENKELKHIKTTGGHYKYSRKDLNRPVIIQSHVDPVPLFIVENTLKNIGSNKQELENFLSPEKGSKERKSKVAKKGKRSNKGKKP